MKRRPYKRIRRIQKTTIIALLLLVILTMGFTLHPQERAEFTQTITRMIQKGDTLWDIAQEYNPEGHDIRNYVAMISRVNDLHNQPLMPGETILIPILP